VSSDKDDVQSSLSPMGLVFDVVVEMELDGVDETECWEHRPFEKGQVEGQEFALANERGCGIEHGSVIVGPW